MTVSEQNNVTKDIDLTAEPPSPAKPPTGTGYSPARAREWVRASIAGLLLLLLIGIVATVMGGLLAGWLSFDHLEKVGAIILSPVVALLGAVMGFYFGEQSRDRVP